MANTAEGAKASAAATVKVRVLRAFLLKTEPQKVGKEMELPRLLALELHGLNKVEFIKPEPKAKKESSNAQQ
jgi:hypothetical protein